MGAAASAAYLKHRQDPFLRRINRCNEGGSIIEETTDQKLLLADDDGICYISVLPDHILKLIFSRLPLTTLTRCRYVCKSWRLIILSPDFANFHLSTRKPTSLFLCMREQNLVWLEFDGDMFQSDLGAVVRNPLSFIPPSFKLMNSCNGLVCMYQELYEAVHIINPLTSDCFSVQLREKGRTLYTGLCGLGFDPESKKFKLVRVSCPENFWWGGLPRYGENMQFQADMGTLEHGGITWRRIEGLPQYGEFSRDSLRTHVNGFLHSLCFWENTKAICACDFQAEKFKSLSLPPAYYESRTRNLTVTINLGVFRDSLTLTYLSTPGPRWALIDIWMMTEYGVEESWTHLFTIEREGMGLPMSQLLENGDILMYRTLINDMLLYNPRGNRYIKLRERGFHSTIYPVAYHPSFVSVKDSLGDSKMLFKSKQKAPYGGVHMKAMQSLVTTCILLLFIYNLISPLLIILEVV